MKKFVLSLALVATMVMASCQPSAKKAEDEGAAIKAKIENCSDTDSLKIYVQQAKDYADKLVKEGDDAAAKAYLDEVTPVVQAKDPEVAKFFETMECTADSAVNAVKEKADSTADATKDAAKAVVDGAKQGVDNAVQAGKDKVNEAANAANNAVNNAANSAANAAKGAVDAGKQKASDAVQQGADKLKDKIKK